MEWIWLATDATGSHQSTCWLNSAAAKSWGRERGTGGGGGRGGGGESMWGAGFSAMHTCLQSGVVSLVQGCLLLLVSIQVGG